MIAVSESFGIATGCIGSASQLTTAIAFLINDLESHSKKEISLLPEISKMYLKVKNEMSGKHDGDD